MKSLKTQCEVLLRSPETVTPMAAQDMCEHILALETIVAAAEKLVRCKGRYHSEQNYRALAALFGVTSPDLPPLDGEAPEPVILYRERNPYNGMVTGWQELTQQEFDFIKDNASENAEFKTLYAAPEPVAVPDDLREAVSDLLAVLDEYPEQLVPINRNSAVVRACRTAMLQGKAVSQPKLPDVIDANLIEALRLVQCMLDDYREQNYGHAQQWIRHINARMSEYSETHEDDAYSVLHDFLPAAPQQEKPA